MALDTIRMHGLVAATLRTTRSPGAAQVPAGAGQAEREGQPAARLEIGPGRTDAGMGLSAEQIHQRQELVARLEARAEGLDRLAAAVRQARQSPTGADWAEVGRQAGEVPGGAPPGRNLGRLLEQVAAGQAPAVEPDAARAAEDEAAEAAAGLRGMALRERLGLNRDLVGVENENARRTEAADLDRAAEALRGGGRRGGADAADAPERLLAAMQNATAIDRNRVLELLGPLGR